MQRSTRLTQGTLFAPLFLRGPLNNHKPMATTIYPVKSLTFLLIVTYSYS